MTDDDRRTNDDRELSAESAEHYVGEDRASVRGHNEQAAEAGAAAGTNPDPPQQCK